MKNKKIKDQIIVFVCPITIKSKRELYFCLCQNWFCDVSIFLVNKTKYYFVKFSSNLMLGFFYIINIMENMS